MGAGGSHASTEDTRRLCRAIGLQHYPDTRPGIRREKRGTGFSYIGPDGARIRSDAQRQALAALAIPPAYTDVWISPVQNGHLLATGWDAAERKQYRYHPDWTAYQQARKFESLPELGARLPRLRRWIARMLRDDPGSHDSAIAAALCLIERHSLRVGNPQYSRENGTFAATTLRRRHLRGEGEEPFLLYPAKGGQIVEKRLRGAALLTHLLDGPKAETAPLVAWQAPGGRWRPVSPNAVRERLCELVDLDVTPRLLRTWNGSRAAFLAARSHDAPTLKQVAEAASEALHNTPAIARLSYIHPAIIDAVQRGQSLPENGPVRSGFKRGEGGLLALLARA